MTWLSSSVVLLEEKKCAHLYLLQVTCTVKQSRKLHRSTGGYRGKETLRLRHRGPLLLLLLLNLGHFERERVSQLDSTTRDTFVLKESSLHFIVVVVVSGLPVTPRQFSPQKMHNDCFTKDMWMLSLLLRMSHEARTYASCQGGRCDGNMYRMQREKRERGNVLFAAAACAEVGRGGRR